MKLFKNFKTKRQLRKEIEKLKRDYDDLKEDYELQKKKFRGERICSGYCNQCKYGAFNGYDVLGHAFYICLLDCKCKDFKVKESEG